MDDVYWIGAGITSSICGQRCEDALATIPLYRERLDAEGLSGVMERSIRGVELAIEDGLLEPRD